MWPTEANPGAEANHNAVVNVNGPEAPTILLSKTAKDATNPEQETEDITTDQLLAYDITITNTSPAGGPTMENPVLIDLLPLGTSLPDSGPNDAPCGLSCRRPGWA